MLIRFLTARTFKAHCFTYPIRAFADHLRQLGLTVKLHHRTNPTLFDCDVLCVGTEFFVRQKRLNREPKSMWEFVRRHRSDVPTLVWFDTTASTGTTYFQVMPFVDLYAKNQLLRDHSLYTTSLHGNRYYSEYYNRHRGIVDTDVDRLREPAQPEQLSKLAVSWNLGLGDYRTFTKWGRRVRILWPWANYRPEVTPAWADRDIDVSYRVAMHSHLATIAYHREETRRRLEDIAATGKYRVVLGSKVPHREYQEEIRRTRVLPSPFGLGEFCFRDIECLRAGAALFKPDMSHLETWPDYYEPDITYVPYSWDFSDFQDKLVELLESPVLRRRIAAAGQQRYLDSVSPAGGEAFGQHFASLIRKAIRE